MTLTSQSVDFKVKTRQNQDKIEATRTHADRYKKSFNAVESLDKLSAVISHHCSNGGKDGAMNSNPLQSDEPETQPCSSVSVASWTR